MRAELATNVPKEKKMGKKKGFDEYEVESAAQTLIEAQKVKGDRALLKAATKEVEKQAKATTKALQGIRGKK